MYTLEIKKSSSKNFPKVLETSLSLGGVYNDNLITIEVKEEMEAYNRLFPLFKYNVLKWKGTKAYHNGKQVHPYRFMFANELKRKRHFNDVVGQLEFGEYTYYKRQGNTFYFKNESFSFEMKMEGKELYLFTERYSIGDTITY